MRTSLLNVCLNILFALMLMIPAAQGAVLFQDDFEDGGFDVGVANPQPTWNWPSNTTTTGPTAWFTITSAPGTVHNGNYALKLDYLARNGYANTCGGTTGYQKAGYTGTYFVSSTGANLTQTPYVGSGSIVGRYLYDKTKNFTLWQIAEVANQDATNDRLNLTLVTPGPGYDSSVTISAGDECYVCRACGVDGSIGGSTEITRRNDCDAQIEYLSGFSAFPYGSTIYRRFYFKFSSDYAKPTTGQKLGYYHTVGGGAGAVVTVERGGVRFKELAQSSTSDLGGFYACTGYPTPVETGRWYYLEEMWKSGSSSGAADGEYRCWFARDGEDPGNPVIALTGKSLRPIAGSGAGGMSIWGNNQSTEDRAGYAYIDDIVVSTTRVGPTGGPPPDTTAPAVPAGVDVTAP